MKKITFIIAFGLFSLIHTMEEKTTQEEQKKQIGSDSDTMTTTSFLPSSTTSVAQSLPVFPIAPNNSSSVITASSFNLPLSISQPINFSSPENINKEDTFLSNNNDTANYVVSILQQEGFFKQINFDFRDRKLDTKDTVSYNYDGFSTWNNQSYSSQLADQITSGSFRTSFGTALKREGGMNLGLQDVIKKIDSHYLERAFTFLKYASDSDTSVSIDSNRVKALKTLSLKFIQIGLSILALVDQAGSSEKSEKKEKK